MTAATMLNALGPLSFDISPATLQSRIAGVRQWMARAQVDAVVVYGAPGMLGSRTTSAGYIRYLTGWMTAAQPVMLVLSAHGRPVVVTMGPHPARVWRSRVSEFADVLITNPVSTYPAEVGSLVRGIGGEVIAVAGFDEMPGPLHGELHRLLDGYRVVDAERAIDSLRLRRHPEEVRMHRASAAISDHMVATAMERAAAPGMTGSILMADIEHAGREFGADFASAWLAIGERPETTYMEQSEVARPIGPRDRVQVGTTVSYQGHFGQTLRIGVRAKPSTLLVDYSKILIDIQDAALEVMRPGVKLHRVVDTIEAAIDQHCPFTRTSDPFRFQSCHGLGLSYVEPGTARDLNAGRDRSLDPEGVELAENMVLEIHPNFTIPELGHICAGDMAVVTATGAQWLTTFPRGLHQI